MKQTDTSLITWHTELRPDAYGQKLYITLTGGTNLHEVERREYLHEKRSAVCDYLDSESRHGRERYCTVDTHAMEQEPHSVILMGAIHDLEDLKDHLDGKKKSEPHQTALWSKPDMAQPLPTAHTTQRSNHLRLVVSNGIVLD